MNIEQVREWREIEVARHERVMGALNVLLDSLGVSVVGEAIEAAAEKNAKAQRRI